MNGMKEETISHFLSKKGPENNQIGQIPCPIELNFKQKFKSEKSYRNFRVI